MIALLKEAWFRYYTVRWLAFVLNVYVCAFIIHLFFEDKPSWFGITSMLVSAAWVVTSLALTIISMTEYPRETWRKR